MKKIVLALALMTGTAAQAEVLWTYGTNGSSNVGRNNANEFRSNNGSAGVVGFSGSFTGSPIRMDTQWTAYGYLHDSLSFREVCSSRGLPCANHWRNYASASELEFTFTNDSTKSCTDLALQYHRHGSEEDLITYTSPDSTMSTFVGGGSMEANQLIFNRSLPGVIAAGDSITLSIDYNGSGRDNGHFIDHIRMVGVCTAECDLTIDTDGDRIPDCHETNTSTFVSATDAGTDPNNPDTDGDGILDGDEVLGTVAGLDLPAMGVSPLKKNILLEYDWFDDSNDCGAHSHRPTAAAIARFTDSFANSSVTNPDGTTGIAVINDYGQGGVFNRGNLIADADGVISGGVSGADFLGYKAANFDSNRNGYFHYVLNPHRYNTTSGSSGQAEINGDDLIVSLQCFQSTSNVANTIAHELGHNLNLRHGGNENCNWKPNYNSVMNYRHQFPGVDTNCDAVGDGVLDFSNGNNISLDEISLNENNGVCGVGTTAIDWNSNGVLESPVFANINPNGNGTCGTFSTLRDFDDWSNLSYIGINDGDGNRASPPELSVCAHTPAM